MNTLTDCNTCELYHVCNIDNPICEQEELKNETQKESVQ